MSTIPYQRALLLRLHQRNHTCHKHRHPSRHTGSIFQVLFKVQGGFLEGPEITGLFLPSLPTSISPQHQRSNLSINKSIQSVPRPSSIILPPDMLVPPRHYVNHNPRNLDIIESPFSNVSKIFYPVPKVTSPSPINESMGLGGQHAAEILGKSNNNISFPLLPNKSNSLEEFGSKGKKQLFDSPYHSEGYNDYYNHNIHKHFALTTNHHTTHTPNTNIPITSSR